ncbi:hypothetical protein NLU13_3951 [Sarocladium strictum]|uniref:Uncharacterized protein n=1 Tax=Sarocladium strictum TaxID=5046 RepID=A0AA39L7R9_SARSR|nr:hypothetical protein NLU13_3951 [Sarocladium strictum]
MADDGTLISPSYVPYRPTLNDIILASIIWGISLGVALFTFASATVQTMRAWRETRRVTLYMILMWLEWSSCTAMGVLSWLFLTKVIRPSLEYFLFFVILWCLQIHALMQIIIDRIAVVGISCRTTSRLRWGVFLLLLAVNIAAACCWIPAQLQLSSSTLVKISSIFDLVQKGFVILPDVLLNFYFLFLVVDRFDDGALSKHNSRFWFNTAMVVVSVALDVMLVLTMAWLKMPVYVQFQPLAYLLKLQIDMELTDMVNKLARASDAYPSDIDDESDAQMGPCMHVHYDDQVSERATI